MKIRFKKLAKSLTGISTPLFGVSWNPPESDREIVRKLIIFLEDRRALFTSPRVATSRYVERSMGEIRKELTSTLQRIGDNPEISPHLRAMRAACRKYLNDVSSRKLMHYRGRERETFEIFSALGELRGIFGIHIAQLAVKYGIDVERELASILPIEDR